MKNTLSGNEGRGFMKILVAADSDMVVGVHLIGPETAEIIQVGTRLSMGAMQPC
jgi:glutathione reductase (NADPH)